MSACHPVLWPHVQIRWLPRVICVSLSDSSHSLYLYVGLLLQLSGVVIPVCQSGSWGQHRIQELSCQWGHTDLGGFCHPWDHGDFQAYTAAEDHVCVCVSTTAVVVLITMSPICYQMPHEAWGLDCILWPFAVQWPCCHQSLVDLGVQC